jgi:hypothetical protein
MDSLSPGFPRVRQTTLPPRPPNGAGANPPGFPRVWQTMLSSRLANSACGGARRVPHAGRERGSVTIWLLGLAVMLLFLGGLSLDLWRAFTERQALASAVDAAAIAGASGIDEPRFRVSGTLALAPPRAEQLAWDNLRAQPVGRRLTAAQVQATAAQVEVAASTTVDFTLLGVLLPGDAPFTVTARAVSVPVEAGA